MLHFRVTFHGEIVNNANCPKFSVVSESYLKFARTVMPKNAIMTRFHEQLCPVYQSMLGDVCDSPTLGRE